MKSDLAVVVAVVWVVLTYLLLYFRQRAGAVSKSSCSDLAVVLVVSLSDSELAAVVFQTKCCCCE